MYDVMCAMETVFTSKILKIFQKKLSSGYPVPDYYSLALEIFRDRTTNVTMRNCSRDLKVKGHCPTDVQTNQMFVVRAVNGACLKMRKKYSSVGALVPSMHLNFQTAHRVNGVWPMWDVHDEWFCLNLSFSTPPAVDEK
ncbi:hypothetical protein HELRODRAFT_171780 [Helobdella robusta]|uniref:Uncharacterized protein n=1 Tax=Helobdella robusta TaxID=6412 RepID=T1F4N8_HELRO|nr:hypothetical protein HELRODRAFT_171780 [Helobdella robusta]ESO05389.1 hypothetical protein HELRODRAFT_171780 [Helobdella robusta]